MSSEFAETWRRFAALPRTRPSLAAARSTTAATSDHLILLVTLAREAAVARAARRLQASLDLDFVTPVHRSALHITVLHLDHRERLTAERQSALAESAAAVLAELAPFDVTIGGANSFDVAAFLEVHDGGVFRSARARLREALPWLADEGRDPLVRDGVDVYLPHVSVAYYNAEADASGVVAALGGHRDEVVVKVRIATVKLVAVTLPLPSADAHYDVEASFRLGRRRSSKRGDTPLAGPTPAPLSEPEGVQGRAREDP